MLSSVGRLLGAALVGAVAASQGDGVLGYQAAFASLLILALFVLLTALSLKSKADELMDTAPAQQPATT